MIMNIGPRKPMVSKMIKESGGSLIHSQQCQLDILAEQFGSSNFPHNGPPTAFANETVRVNNSHPPEVELVTEVGFLKSH